MKKALFYLFIFMVCQVAAGIAVGIVLPLTGNADDAQMQVYSILASSGLSALAVMAIFFGRKWCPVSLAYLRSNPSMVLMLSSLAALGSIVPSAWLQEMLPDTLAKDLLEDTFTLILSRPEGYIFVGLLAPFVEEVVFRGAVLRTLLQWTSRGEAPTSRSIRIAVAISAFFFALIHFNPAQAPHAFAIGLLLGWMYVRTGSIVPGIVFHWANNSAAFIMAMAFPDIPADAKLAEYFGNNDSMVLMAVALSLLVFIPAVWQLNVKMKKAN